MYIDRARRQFAQQGDLTLADLALGIVRVRTDDASRPALVIRNGAVGKCVVGLFLVAVALHDQELLLHIRAFDTAHGGIEQGPDVTPYFTPDLACRTPDRPGMLAADDRPIGIVIEINEFFAPADPDRLARSQHDAHGRLQALRPMFGRAQRTGRPIVGANEVTGLATTGEKAERVRQMRG